LINESDIGNDSRWIYRTLEYTISTNSSHGDVSLVLRTYLSEVTRVILVEKNSVVVLATSISSTTRVSSVLSNTTMSCTYVPSLLSVMV
jgi:hypothetical protein